MRGSSLAMVAGFGTACLVSVVEVICWWWYWDAFWNWWADAAWVARIEAIIGIGTGQTFLELMAFVTGVSIAQARKSD